MLGILRAFAWLRWRMFVNSLERTGSRDALERFSVAIEKLGPLLAGLLLVPSALGLAGLGVAGGYMLSGGERSMAFEAARYLLIAAPALALAGPFFLPAADRSNPIRLLLLPIPRSTLYVAQASSAFGDPWTMLLVPLLGGLVIGLAAGGALIGALLCLAGAALLIAVVVGLSALATSVLHLVVRDRRRGELAALIFIVIIPVVAMLPGLMGGSSNRSRGTPRAPILPAWATAAGGRALSIYPTEVFVRGTRAAATGDVTRAAASVGGLAVTALLIHAIGWMAFKRVLENPGTTGARRSAPMRAAWNSRLPGLSSGASAVAMAQLRLALRTPRGRSILLSPLAAFVIFGMMMYRGSGQMDLGPFRFGSGIGLAAFASFMCLLSILPIAMNQFAVDKAGLTMVLLSPLTDRELLAGKAVGNALITAPPILMCMAAALLLFPGGAPGLWLSMLLGILSVNVLTSPVAAICSASFPRAVDMNSIGKGSNAHSAAGFIGLLAFVASAAPPIGLTILAINVLGSATLAAVLVAVWCVVAYAIALALFIPARRIFAARRENLANLI